MGYSYTMHGLSHSKLMAYAPDPINGSCAWQVVLGRVKYGEIGALTNEDLTRMDYSACTPDNPLCILRAMTLTIFKALPFEAFDRTEDRWGLDATFQDAWLEAVVEAQTSTNLMAAVLMLEYGIKNTYRKGLGSKLMNCLPSRFLSLRKA